ncbi:hypothetical protein [Erwinia pyrifoliae]|uniref:hypothetical protein n=1 Tax=Erwinia pyrifoliae TaxID=79967 RepID=UPI0001960F90|nr:hypothetical protein [Erwinia pyrifoliae]UWS28746.1 hypothetical protein NYP81_12440 [Erwinia pyrifoliae]UXK11737.1 hypothetical protein NYP80_15755 [Erwinia pyrifoliae]CAX54421.1 uncharacterized protein EpC_06420 [Erwinia pyrifoliae Ep1/96]
MSVIVFLMFLMGAVFYIWNGNDFFDRASWLKFGLKFLAIFTGIIIFGFFQKGLMAIFPSYSNELARYLMTRLGLSFLSVLGMKFLVVMLCTMFSGFMRFHKKYNSENYQALSSLSNGFSPSLLILAKCVVSCGSVLIFYGIWLA